MPNRIRVGLVTNAGGAHVGAYLQALAATQECEKVLLSDPDKRWHAEAARVLGPKFVNADPEPRKMLAASRPEMTLVTMEARLAPPLIQAALENGCHVFAGEGLKNG